MPGHYKGIRFCEICNIKLNKFQHYTCSNKCDKLRRHNISLKNKCIFCGAPCRNKFCSFEHAKSFESNNSIDLWLSGQTPIEKTYSGIDNKPSVYIKRYLIKLSNNKCQKCGWSEINQTTGLVPLQINHIDGDSTNNNPKNLEYICPNCHSLTETYGCYGKGRSGRMKMRSNNALVAESPNASSCNLEKSSVKI